MLKNRALLVSVSLHLWRGTKQNKEITEEVLASKSAQEGAGRWTDRLIDPKAKEFKEVKAAFNAVATFHREMTLPWNDKGTRILPNRRYQEYTDKMKELTRKAERSADSFVAVFNRLVDDARINRGQAFDPGDYPAVTELRDRFGVDIQIDPMPELTDDFRATLTEADLKAAEARAEEKYEQAMQDTWKRIADTIGRMAGTLREPDKVFRNSMIRNLESLSDLIPDFNLTDDPRLAEIHKAIQDKLEGYDPDTLRQDKAVRKQVADSADEILRQMAGYTGGGTGLDVDGDDDDTGEDVGEEEDIADWRAEREAKEREALA